MLSSSNALRRALAAAAVLSLTLPAWSASAQGAQPTAAAQQEAATRFKKGLELFKDGDYQAALIEFRRANELAPNYNVLYNIGQVSFQLQDYPNALRSLERYLEEGGKSIDAKRRAEVEKDIEKLRARVANLEINVNVGDAEVAIDDVTIGKSPLSKTVLVSAGRHKVTVTKTGFSPVTKVVEIASSETQKVPIELSENKSTATPPVEPPKNPDTPQNPPVDAGTPPVQPPGGDTNQPPPPAPRSIPWAGWAVTGGLAAGAVVTGVLALGASSDLKTKRTSANPTSADLDSAKTKTQTLALVTDILTGCAVVAGGVTLYFTIAGGSSSAPAADKAKPALLRPEVKVGFTPGGLKLVGQF
jgi:PEGA domain/Tetratricopeptide repeat